VINADKEYQTPFRYKVQMAIGIKIILFFLQVGSFQATDFWF